MPDLEIPESDDRTIIELWAENRDLRERLKANHLKLAAMENNFKQATKLTREARKMLATVSKMIWQIPR